jgi:hypothetical protein
MSGLTADQLTSQANRHRVARYSVPGVPVVCRIASIAGQDGTDGCCELCRTVGSLPADTCQCRCLHSERSTGLAWLALDFVAYRFVLWATSHDLGERSYLLLG